MPKIDIRLLGDSYALAHSLGLVDKPLSFGFFRGDTDKYLKELNKETEINKAVKLLQEAIDGRTRSV